MRIARLFLVLTLVAGLALAQDPQATSPQPTKKKVMDPAIVELVNKVDAKMATVQTIKARFHQHRKVALMKDPVDMDGTFYFKRENGFKFEFDKQHDLVLIMNNEETVSLSPEAKRADRIKIKKRQGQFVQKLLTDKIKSLSEYFQITMVPLAEGEKGHHLLLQPSKRRLKKKFQDLHIWLSEDHFIQHIRVNQEGGDVFELVLTDIKVNADIPSELFVINIPPDYKVGERMEFLMGMGVTL